jgi:signal peptidase
MSTATLTAGRPVASHRAPRRPYARRLLNLVASLLLGVGLLGFLFLAVGPHLLGYRTATMLTGSMEPGIAPGDVVVTVPRPASELAVGDVISYHIPVEDHRVETHRVTEVRHVDGKVVFRTQGDANDNVDPWTATLDGDTVWEMRAVVPHLGTAVRALRSPVVQHGVLWVGFGGLLLLGLTTIWGRDDSERDA